MAAATPRAVDGARPERERRTPIPELELYWDLPSERQGARSSSTSSQS
jgi:hypothetical protein